MALENILLVAASSSRCGVLVFISCTKFIELHTLHSAHTAHTQHTHTQHTHTHCTHMYVVRTTGKGKSFANYLQHLRNTWSPQQLLLSTFACRKTSTRTPFSLLILPFAPLPCLHACCAINSWNRRPNSALIKTLFAISIQSNCMKVKLDCDVPYFLYIQLLCIFCIAYLPAAAYK